MDKDKPTSVIAWQQLIFALGQKIGTSLRLGGRAFLELFANKLLKLKLLIENNLSQFNYRFLQREFVIIKPQINFLSAPITASRALNIGEEANK